MIKIDKTFELVTPESAQEGEVAEHGFLLEGENLSFRELVSLMQAYNNPSSYPASGSIFEWLSAYPEPDYLTGGEFTESIHYSADNPTKNQKYWKKAMLFAGLMRGAQ